LGPMGWPAIGLNAYVPERHQTSAGAFDAAVDAGEESRSSFPGGGERAVIRGPIRRPNARSSSRVVGAPFPDVEDHDARAGEGHRCCRSCSTPSPTWQLGGAVGVSSPWAAFAAGQGSDTGFSDSATINQRAVFLAF
jgi:hypothetical protein